MKIKANKDELSEAISWVSNTTQINATQIYMTGIKITAEKKEGGKITFSSYNFKSSSTYIISGEVIEEGELLFLGKQIFSIIKSFQNNTVTITKEENKLYFQTEFSKYSFPIISLEEYPKLPELPQKIGTLDTKTFINSVNQVSFATFKDNSLPSLTGVNFEFQESSISLSATDRYRIAIKNMPFKSDSKIQKNTALLKSNYLTDITKMFLETESIYIHFDSNNLIGFSTLNKHVTLSLIDASFSNIKNIIPTEIDSTCVFNLKDLLEATNRLILTIEKNGFLLLSLSKNEAVLNTTNHDSIQGVESLLVKYTGEPIVLKFNPQFFIQGLKAITTQSVSFSITKLQNNATPVLIEEYDNSSIKKDYLYLLAPVAF